jgi:hypothetical protein
MLKTLRNLAEPVFALVLLWKAALLVFTAQPIPANDSFFYDGAVVNLLVHGQYCNPSIANALPISGNELFSAYPPLYQLALLGWMKCFGTSGLAAMWLHFVLFALYAALVLATLRELRAPAWATHFAGLFLLGITFHDRPDSLAQVFGMAAIFAATRVFGGAMESGGGKPSRGWAWLAALNVILCLCTSLQIGGIYFLLIWLAMVLLSRHSKSADGRARLSQRAEMGVQPDGALGQPRPAGPAWLALPPAWPALLVMTLVPLVLVLAVKLLWPHLWAGFQEHAQQTPSLTSWRLPDVMEIIKIIRSVPGVLLVLALLPAVGWRWCGGGRAGMDRRRSVILLSTSAACFAVLVAALCFLTANLVLIAAYLQPLIVGLFLSLWAGMETKRFQLNIVRMSLGLAVVLVSVRAVGLTTTGVACARDVSRNQAHAAVTRELAATPDHAAVAVSAAYLYDGWSEARRLRLIHSDWLGPAVKDQPNADVDALRAVKPARLILTQFDYHRRYVRVLAQLQSMEEAVSVRVENLARVRPPDASPRWQRVVQHVAWAPVMVTLEWAETAP